MTTHAGIVNAIETTLHAFIHEHDDRHVHDGVEINNGYCRWFANDTLDYLGHPDDVIRHDAFWFHTWLELDGRHYDAEHPEGVDDPHNLRVWPRLTRESLQAAADEVDVLTYDQLVGTSPEPTKIEA